MPSSPVSDSTVRRIIDRIEHLLSCVDALLAIEALAKRQLGLADVLHSEGLQRLVGDPLAYFAGKANVHRPLALEELAEVLLHDGPATHRVSTSVAGQLRSVFEAWIFVGLITELAPVAVESEDPLLPIVPGPVLRLSAIPRQPGRPTTLLTLEGGERLALFLDSPLPYLDAAPGKEGRSRPDIGVYRLEPSSSDGNRLSAFTWHRAELIALIECKESTVWPWTRKDIIDPRGVSAAKINVSHLEMLLLYAELYRPHLMVLASKERTPPQALATIAEEDIVILDNTQLEPVVHRTLAGLVTTALP